ncbi:MAG: DUF7844 domain-containing protein [Pseudobdellovibrionaceae bacterium]
MKQIMWNLIFYFVALLFSVKSNALTIVVKPTELTVNELIAVNRLVAQAMDALPALVKEKMQTTLQLEFKNFAKESQWGMAQHEVFDGNKIYLNKSLLPEIVAGSKNSQKNIKWATRLKTLNDIALGTIIHEVAHFYDQWDSTTISSTSEFLHLTYFKNDSDKSQNNLAVKSPNWYEFTNSAESFAVNFEFFLLDPDFKCRKPLLYDFYSAKVFKHTPFPNYSCSMLKKVFQTGNIIENGASEYVDLDFDKLYQVHYLLAGKGPDMSSKWGHAMLRLVFCAPERTVKGPECLKDLSYHKVLSYRAIPTSDSVSFVNGVTGKYPSFLFVMPFTQIVSEYTVDQLRDLQSIPLKMNDEQMKNVLLHTLEVHWSYRGKYYFFSNNCAVETLNFLKTILPEIPEFENADAITPQGVLDVLSESHLADLSSFQDLKTAWKQGLYYYPNGRIPELAFKKLLQRSATLRSMSFEDFIYKTSSMKRNQIYREVFAQKFSSKIELDGYYASSMYLEKQISKKLKTKLYNEAFLKMSELNDNAQSNDASKNTWTDSWYYGYGIPTEQDFNNYYLAPQSRKQAQLGANADAIKKKMDQFWDPEMKAEYANCMENLKWIKAAYDRGP